MNIETKDDKFEDMLKQLDSNNIDRNNIEYFILKEIDFIKKLIFGSDCLIFLDKCIREECFALWN